MTDQEAEELFQGIIENLKQHHLSEIISMVEDQIAESWIVEDEVKTFRENLNVVQNALPTLGSGSSHLKSYGKGSFSTVVPYTPKERLEILINIIEQTLFVPSEILEYLKTSFLEKRSLKRLEFLSPGGESLVRIDQQDLLNPDQMGLTNHFRKVLDTLRKVL